MPPTQADLERAALDAVTQRRVEEIERTVKELKEDRDKFLRWGVIVLGGTVVGLVTWIFKLVTRLQ